MEPLSFRPATEADVPFLLELRLKTMRPHLAAAGIVATEAEHLCRIRAAFNCAEVLLQAGNPVGLLKVVREAHQWELVQIQLAPSIQGKGFGTMLLQSLITEARLQNASLRLSVLKANPAKHLYERLGFTVLAEKTDAYEMVLGT
ncbi:GNAT family N-acetyltransferase [Niveibacterium terrae]|uniref:GNAT family N-acetyltransferase n=1 Tax=Niveibacterium terrae TaxID=3373598 RepID=UPI003A940BBD